MSYVYRRKVTDQAPDKVVRQAVEILKEFVTAYDHGLSLANAVCEAQALFGEDKESQTRSLYNMWEVGFYTPDGRWVPESEHSSAELAMTWVSFLNGGSRKAHWSALDEIEMDEWRKQQKKEKAAS